MAITNAQQYKQILQKMREAKAFGGVMGKDGRRAYVGGSYGGGYGEGKGKGLGGYQGRGDPSTGGVAGGAGTGPGGQGGSGDGGSTVPTTTEEQKKLFKDLEEQDKKVTKEMFDRGQSNFREQFNDYSGGARMLDSDYSTFSQRNNQKYQNRIFNQARTNIIEQLKKQGLLTDEDNDMTVEELRDKFQVSTDTKGADYGDRSLNLDALKGIKSIQDYVDDGFYKKDGVFDKNSNIYDEDRIPNPFKSTGIPTLDFLGKKMSGPLTQEYLTKQFNNLEDMGSIPFDYDRDTSIKGLMKEYEPNRYEREYGDTTSGRDDQETDPCKGPNPPAYCFVDDKKEEDEVNPRDYTGLAPRFMGSIFDFTGLAEGGIARAGAMDGGRMRQMEMMQEEDDPTGGIMDLESGRQMYFLGKLVKKAGRAIKKVVKSPIGKAALLYFGGNALMSGGGGGLSSLFKSGKGLKLKNFLTDSIMGKAIGVDSPAAKNRIVRSGGLLNFMKDHPYLSILGGSTALAGLSGKDEDEDGPIDYGLDIDIDRLRYAPYRTLAPSIIGSNYQTGTEGRKDGGRMGYQEGGDAEPVAKKTMPLLDMDGMEKDYRADGGFVPIGRMERADDVPARLSKNEFVFTADAVRNAGDGDIDKGAEVMYNMMKNLESGGEVSEESQGLDGAREMFQTSKRLEEVL